MRLPAANPLLFSVLTAAVFACAAQAKVADRNQPMDIRADNSEAVLSDDSDSTLNGNVVITQGSLEVKADKAVIHRKKGSIESVLLTGAPALLKQISDNGEPMTARAERIAYDLDNDKVVLTGGAVVEQPRGNMNGETITYDLKTGRLNGGGDGKRVQMRLMPKTQPAGSAN